MPHIILKPTLRIETGFKAIELTNGIELPEESTNIGKEYMTSNLLSDNYGVDLMIFRDKDV
jgi:hypothetical protein